MSDELAQTRFLDAEQQAHEIAESLGRLRTEMEGHRNARISLDDAAAATKGVAEGLAPISVRIAALLDSLDSLGLPKVRDDLTETLTKIDRLGTRQDGLKSRFEGLTQQHAELQDRLAALTKQHTQLKNDVAGLARGQGTLKSLAEGIQDALSEHAKSSQRESEAQHKRQNLLLGLVVAVGILMVVLTFLPR